MTKNNHKGRVKLKDLASELGLSESTVSRALNDLTIISPETRSLVQEAATKSGYIRNNVARGLALRQSHLIGMMVSDIANPFFSEVARGVHDVAQEHSYVVALCNTERRVEREDALSQALLANQVAGLIFVGGTMGETHLERLQKQGIPFVIAGRRIRGLHVPTIAVDNVAVGYMATQHLIGLGHKKIMYLSGSANSATSRDRQRGYEDAMQSKGYALQLAGGNFKIEDGFVLAEQLVQEKRRPTAVFAANDRMAVGLVLGLINLGLKVPDDLAIVGCDDIPLASMVRPKLTTIRVPMYEIGARAMRTLLGVINAPQEIKADTVLLGCELVVRGST
ncbi:MAG: LacI family DNA-binding transcriptional regulator [Blastocatellia bacterium]